MDSTLLIQAERNRLSPDRLIAEIIDRWGDVEIAMSAMSAGELLHGCWRADTAPRRARREEFVEALFSALPVVSIGLPIMRIFGEVDASPTCCGEHASEIRSPHRLHGPFSR